MKKLLLATSVALLASSTLAATPEPNKCPNVSAFGQTTFDSVREDFDGTWMAGIDRTNFDTNETWTFYLYNINARNRAEAFKAASTSMSSLEYDNGPNYDPDYFGHEIYYCNYDSATGVAAFAFTPSIIFSKPNQHF